MKGASLAARFSPRTCQIGRKLSIENPGHIQQSPGTAGMAICVRGRYRFAVKAKTGLPEWNQAKIKRVHPPPTFPA